MIANHPTIYWFLILLLSESFLPKIDGYQNLDELSAKHLLKKIEFVSNKITRGISHWYNYTYDGGYGNFIVDGGNDMFDNGNYVYFKRGSTHTSYTDINYNTLYSRDGFNVYSQTIHPFTTLMWINSTVGRTYYWLRVINNVDYGRSYNNRISGSGIENGFNYYFQVIRDYSGSDPTVCVLYFYVWSTQHWNSVQASSYTLHSFTSTSRSSKQSEFYIYGRPQRVLMGYMLLSKTSYQTYSTTEIRRILSLILEQFYVENLDLTTREFMGRLISSSASITSQISNWYNYSYDGGSHSINNGGNNMFQQGNYISFKRNNDTYITAAYNRLYYGRNRSDEFYSRTTYPFTAIWKIWNPYGFDKSFAIKIDGNVGTTENKRISVVNDENITINGYHIAFKIFQIYNSSMQPSICELYFCISSDQLWNSYSGSSFNLESYRLQDSSYRTVVTLSGEPQNVFMGYMLLSKTNGNLVEEREIQNVFTELINAINQTQPSLNLSTSIQCGENIVIKINQSDLKQMAMHDADQLILSQSPVIDHGSLSRQCIASTRNPIFNIKWTDCSPHIGKTNNSIILSYAVRAQYNNLSAMISRSAEGFLSLACTYPTEHLLQSQMFSQIQSIKTFYGEFDDFMQMKFYSDENFLNEMNPSTPVTVPNYVYVKISINESAVFSEFFMVKMLQCWATQTSNESDSTSYSIIDDSCAANNFFEPVEAIEVLENFAGPTAKFKFRSFIWNGIPTYDQKIYVHCSLRLCDSRSVNQKCEALNCNSRNRQKRSNENGFTREKRNIYDENDRTFLAGPILIISPGQTSCLLNNGGCSDICNEQNGVVKCYCPSGTSLDSDDKTCIDNNQTYVVIIAVGGSVLVIALIVALVVIYKSRSRK